MKHEAESNITVPIKLLITKQLKLARLATSTNSNWWLRPNREVNRH